MGEEGVGVGVAVATLLRVYFVATASLWLIVFLSEKCWMWQNEHQLPDISRRDLCLAVWWASSAVLVIFQLVCLGLAMFWRKPELSGRWRVILALCAVVVLVTNSLLWILVFLPEIH